MVVRGRSRILFALVISLSAYAIPMVSAHWADFLGVALAKELGSDRELTWKAADVLLAVGLQALLFVISWVVADRGRVAAVLTAALAWLPMAFVANLLYMAVIPAVFLIEADAASDVATWTEECSVPGYALDPVRAGVSRALERRGEAWVRRDDGLHYGIMRLPGCQVEAAAIPEEPMTGLYQALADGGAVYSTMDAKSGTQTFWLLARGAKSGIPLDPPDGVRPHERLPLVSKNGMWVAWIIRGQSGGASVQIRRRSGGEEVLVLSHELLQRATISLVELDAVARRIVINRDLRTFVALRFDGSVAWGPIEAPVAAQQDTFRYLPGTWLAWDAYLDKGPYRVAWPSGTYAIPRGSVITSAALDSRGRFAAVSSTTGLNIGSTPDKVLIVDTVDRSVVLRKTLPRYTRTQVAFLGEGHFAYSDFDGERSTVRVLRIGGP